MPKKVPIRLINHAKPWSRWELGGRSPSNLSRWCSSQLHHALHTPATEKASSSHTNDTWFLLVKRLRVARLLLLPVVPAYSSASVLYSRTSHLLLPLASSALPVSTQLRLAHNSHSGSALLALHPFHNTFLASCSTRLHWLPRNLQNLLPVC